jgi:hypothetical protein
MPSSPSGPIRRGQLIAPFGPGAMISVPGGTSLIIGGLDRWFLSQSADNSNLDMSEYVVEEWRLRKRMRVSEFRLPPDYREPGRWGGTRTNCGHTIPSFRFPAWHFCPSCKLLVERTMYERGSRGRIKCPECDAAHKVRYLFQVPFVAMCDRGHLQDFPWKEWVHRSLAPVCNGDLRLKSTGSATLAGQTVSCDTCGAKRSLAGITSGEEDASLTRRLSEDGPYLCGGNRPWLGDGATEPCSRPLRGSLRNAANIYFASVKTSIYLPRGEDASVQEVVSALETPPVSTLVKMLVDLSAPTGVIIEAVRNSHGRRIEAFTESALARAVDIVRGQGSSEAGGTASDQVPDALNDDEETAFRRAEFAFLREPRETLALTVRDLGRRCYSGKEVSRLSRILLVSRLRETRVFAGFSRVLPSDNIAPNDLVNLLWRTPPQAAKDLWLPANVVHGEGIYLELDEPTLGKWEARPAVQKRIRPLVQRWHQLHAGASRVFPEVSARYVLVHTLSHLLMNRLTFECGYSSAALRERLYISAKQDGAMAGLLIYTADGDSEGTMGGLVRMGRPGLLEPVVRRAFERAQWCSADPVCMEMGTKGGQGPGSFNLAACHNCALVPETACEEFNRLLDRALVVGAFGQQEVGFFVD